LKLLSARCNCKRSAEQQPRSLTLQDRNQGSRAHVSNRTNGTLKTNHAAWGDFCEAFVKDMKPLYLLAFLLTANHQDAEQCFRMALEAASEATA